LYGCLYSFIYFINSILEDKLIAFGQLLEVMNDLREKCPWDKKQTITSLRNLTIEETHELADAISEMNMDDIEEELGDVLLHIVFYAKIGEETGAFNISSIIDKLIKKLKHRHPHIYGDVKADTEEEVKKNWEQLKLQEGKKSTLGGVPRSLPALIKAYRIQEKAGQVGFEWDDIKDVLAKVNEEFEELQEAVASNDAPHVEEEYGDLLFALVNYSRYIKVDPETALERTNKKFITRFKYIEEHAPKPLGEMTLQEMDDLWNEAKGKE
jgi:XTP/dITP diphosphohydrolase